MVEARVPDEMRDWNAVDIFVFSNGQQYSPPRKYHLCSDDLKFWESTISFLAHSQYGSLHSKIDLYTIEGRKVDGPLELINDAAYVAVKPPDLFIQSGYEKYILKATRSWEKRQRSAKSSPNESIHISGNFKINTNTNYENSRRTSLQKPLKDTADHVSVKPLKPKPLSQLKSSSRNSSISKDPIDKKKIISTRTVLRRVNNVRKLSDISSRRESSDLKDICVIDKSVIKESINAKETPIIDAILETESSASPKQPSAFHNNTSQNCDTKNKMLEIEKLKENITSDNWENKNANKPFDSTNVYKNPESDTASEFVEADKLVDSKVKTSSAKDTDNNNNVLNIAINEQGPICKNTTKEETLITKDVGTQKSLISIYEKLQQTQTKECVFNLNLNIEVKDYKEKITNRNFKLNRYFSLTPVNGNEFQENNVDLEQRISNENVSCIDPLKASGSITCTNCDSTKVIVVKCSCSSHKAGDFNNRTLPCKENFKDYVICVPKHEIIHSNSKLQETNDTNDDKSNLQKIMNQEKKGNEIMQEIAIPEQPKGNLRNKETELIIKGDEAKERKVSISNNPEIYETTTISYKPDESTSILKNVHIEPSNTEKESMVHEPQSISTQTEWCDVLVEARPKEDGSYYLHLPSLETLKRCQL